MKDCHEVRLKKSAEYRVRGHVAYRILSVSVLDTLGSLVVAGDSTLGENEEPKGGATFISCFNDQS